MLAQDGGLALRTNGLPEALMDSPGSVPRFSGEYWLSPLAVIARPQARDMLIVGLRRWRRDRRRAAERRAHRRHRARAQGHRGEPRDQRAAPARSAERSARARDPQRRARRAAPHQPPVRRHRLAALASVDRRRLAPLHARIHAAGARSPDARRRVRAVDERDLHGRRPAALADRDPAQRLHAKCASTGRIRTPSCSSPATRRSNLESQLATTGLPLRDAPLHYARFGINNAEDLVAALVLDTDGARQLAVGAPLITDDDNRIATSSVYREGPRHDRRKQRAAARPATIRCSVADSLSITRSLRDQLSFPYLVRRNGVFVLLDPSLADRVGRMAQILGNQRRRRICARVLLPHAAASRNARPRCCGWQSISTRPTKPLRQEYLRDYFGDAGPRRGAARRRRSGRDAHRARGRTARPQRHAAQSEWREVARADCSWRKFPGPTPGTPRPWSCASTGARASPIPSRRGASRDEVDRDDRPHDHHESDAAAVRHARARRLRRAAPGRRGRIGVQLRAPGRRHGARRGHRRRSRCARTPKSLRDMLNDADEAAGRRCAHASPKCAPKSRRWSQLVSPAGTAGRRDAAGSAGAGS